MTKLRVGVLVMSHGRFAEELAHAAEVILGPQERLRALCLDWKDSQETIRQRVATALADLPGDEGHLILTDMFGGTPTNQAMTFHAAGKLDVVTGVNLPMVLKALNLKEGLGLDEAAALVRSSGQRAIVAASELLGEGGEDA